MIPSVYILGGSAVGKSTMSANVIEELRRRGSVLNTTQVDLHKKPKRNGAIVTLRGEEFHGDRLGVYLGSSRDEFPGSDGLDLVSSPVASEWVSIQDTHDFIFSEGAVLTTDRFLGALAESSDLLVLHLVCDPMETELRMWTRSGEIVGRDPKYLIGTATKSRNRVAKLPRGTLVRDVDTSSDSPDDLGEIVEIAVDHLLRG